MAIGTLKIHNTALQTNGYNSNTIHEQETKKTKNSRMCPNECFNGGENTELTHQSLATNIKKCLIRKNMKRLF